jgi:hypothetical protein
MYSARRRREMISRVPYPATKDTKATNSNMRRPSTDLLHQSGPARISSLCQEERNSGHAIELSDQLPLDLTTVKSLKFPHSLREMAALHPPR